VFGLEAGTAHALVVNMILQRLQSPVSARSKATRRALESGASVQIHLCTFETVPVSVPPYSLRCEFHARKDKRIDVSSWRRTPTSQNYLLPGVRLVTVNSMPRQYFSLLHHVLYLIISFIPCRWHLTGLMPWEEETEASAVLDLGTL
jgi:hypothetical protein